MATARNITPKKILITRIHCPILTFAAGKKAQDDIDFLRSKIKENNISIENIGEFEITSTCNCIFYYIMVLYQHAGFECRESII